MVVAEVTDSEAEGASLDDEGASLVVATSLVELDSAALVVVDSAGAVVDSAGAVEPSLETMGTSVALVEVETVTGVSVLEGTPRETDGAELEVDGAGAP